MTFCKIIGGVYILIYNDGKGKYVVEADRNYAPILSKVFPTYREALSYARSSFGL